MKYVFMKKNLPKIKKKIVGFIKEEDAKIVDKSSAKVAFTMSVLLTSFYSMISKTYAYGHSSHTDHSNDFAPAIEGDKAYVVHNLVNFGEDEIVIDEDHGISLPPKSLLSIHSHHYNHSDDGCY